MYLSVALVVCTGIPTALCYNLQHQPQPMPRHQYCSIPGCFSRNDRPGIGGVRFHRLPQDPDLRHQWLVSIKKPVSVSENTRICSMHFEEGVGPRIPTIFPWSVSVKHRHPPTIRIPLPPKKQRSDKPQTPAEIELAVARKEVEQQEEIITQLQGDNLRLREEVKILRSQRFFLQRFEGSDHDIKFYTGLPSYPVFMCLYRYIEPLLNHLRLCRPDVKSVSVQTHKPRARALQPIDELFLVLVRLRLSLLEQDLQYRSRAT